MKKGCWIVEGDTIDVEEHSQANAQTLHATTS